MKPKLAITWLSGCGGCDESLIDLGEDLYSISGQVEIIFWPMVMDAGYSDLDAMDDGQISAAFINGAVRSEAHVRLARLLRRKAEKIFAVGACAHLGGVVGLANTATPAQLLDRVYGKALGINPNKVEPAPSHLRMLDTVQPLDRIIRVDVTVPGCPPTPAQMKQALEWVQKRAYPDKPSVLADPAPLCLTCPLADSRPAALTIKTFNRLYETSLEEPVCFLQNGLACMGPLTRGGCRARCISGNMPCRGCFGPIDPTTDQGARAVAFFASAAQAQTPEEMEAVLKGIVDPVGTFYHFSLAASVLQPRFKTEEK